MTQLETKEQLKDLVTEYFPEAGEDEIDMLLWNETPFPFSMEEDDLREGLKAKKQAETLNMITCDFCPRIIDRSRCLCKEHESVLSEESE